MDINHIIKQSKAFRAAIEPLTGNLDGYDTTQMIELSDEIAKLEKEVWSLHAEFFERWPQIRIDMEKLGDRLVLIKAGGPYGGWGAFCPECFLEDSLRFDGDSVTHTCESLLKAGATVEVCRSCHKVLFTHCNQPHKPAKTKEALYFNGVWVWAPWGFYSDECNPEKSRTLNYDLDTWKGALGLGPSTGWFNFRTDEAPGRLEFLEVVKETKRYYYIKNPYYNDRNRPVRLEKPKHFRIDRIKLITDGWDYCNPLRRVVYRNKILAQAFVAYLPDGQKTMLAEFGIDGDTSPAEVKNLWRGLVKRYHPDAGGDPEKFRMINETFKGLL